MPTIAIVGAGRGLGAAVAHEFAQHGFNVALIARRKKHVDALAAALEAAAAELGTIDVLQYSPVPPRNFMKPVLETTADDLRAPVEQSIYGPITAVQQVLPGMRSIGRGTIVFVNGASAVRPGPNATGTSVAVAGQSAYGQLLHDALAPENIYVGQLIIPRGIGAGEASHEPEALARRIWSIQRDHGEFRTNAECDRPRPTTPIGRQRSDRHGVRTAASRHDPRQLPARPRPRPGHGTTGSTATPERMVLNPACIALHCRVARWHSSRNSTTQKLPRRTQRMTVDKRMDERRDQGAADLLTF